MAQALTIDTLAFSKSLKAAGADEKLADAIVEGLSKVDTSDLASKDDINTLRSEINDLRGEMKDEIVHLDKKIDTLRGEMQVMEHRMTIKLGSMMLVGVGAIVALEKLL